MSRGLRRLLVIGIFAATAACTKETVLKTDHCSAWNPIIPSVKDAMTDETAKQILAHDCVGYRLGCWNIKGMAEACAVPK